MKGIGLISALVGQGLIIMLAGSVLPSILAQPSALQSVSPRPTPEVVALIRQALEAEKKYNWNGALDALNSAYKTALNKKDDFGQALALANIGDIHVNTGQPQKSLDYYQQALPLWRTIGNKAGEAATLSNIGLVYSSSGEPQKALDYQQRALLLFREKRDRSGEASALHRIGYSYAAVGQSQKALEYYKQALPLREAIGDKDGQAQTRDNIGATYASLGQPQKALGYHQQALLLFREKRDRSGEVGALGNIGRVYSIMGQPWKALAYYHQILPLLQETQDKRRQAATLSNIGLVYYSVSEPQKALECYKQALRLLGSEKDKHGESETLNNIGQAYFSIGLPQKALEYYWKARSLFIGLNDTPGEASTLTNIGSVYADIGQPRKALEYDQEAVPIFRAVGDKRREAAALTDIGNVYADIGQPQKALDYFLKALPLQRESNDITGEANTQNSIGTIYSAVGQTDKALENYQHALVLIRKTSNRGSEAVTLGNIGLIYDYLGKSQRALGYYRQALHLVRELHDKRGEASILSSIGTVYADIGQPRKALEYYRQALPIVRARVSKGIDSATLHNIGLVYCELGKPGKALPYFERVLLLYEGTYRQIAEAGQIRGHQQQSVDSFYTNYALVLLQLDRPTDALAMLERGRTNSLARLAEQNRLSLTALLGTDAPAWQDANHRVNAFTEQAQKTKERLNNASAIHDKDNEKILSQRLDALQEEQRQAEADRDRLLARMLHDHPDFQHLFFGQKTTYSTLKKTLLTFPSTADTLFLEFGIVDDKRTLLFALSCKEGLSSFILPVGRKALANKVEKWRSSIILGLPDEPQRAQELYKLLMQPPKRQGKLNLSHYHSLVVVADGPLVDVPFAALVSSDGKRLIHRYVISTPFSLSMLTWREASRSASNNLLAVSNPPVQDLPPLPQAETQAREIVSWFQPAVSLFGSDATKETVLCWMGQCRVVHFGVHGEANYRNGLYSRLLLAGTTEAEQELTAAEITEHPLAAQLAVLSACETMQGQKSGGEGLLGLAWAFRAAGCPSVVASQWTVDETATASLMRRFYWELRKPKTRKDIALQKAMQGVMKEPGHELPYYWAAFQVMGKTDPLRLVPSQPTASTRQR